MGSMSRLERCHRFSEAFSDALDKLGYGTHPPVGIGPVEGFDVVVPWWRIGDLDVTTMDVLFEPEADDASTASLVVGQFEGLNPADVIARLEKARLISDKVCPQEPPGGGDQGGFQ